MSSFNKINDIEASSENVATSERERNYSDNACYYFDSQLHAEHQQDQELFRRTDWAAKFAANRPHKVFIVLSFVLNWFPFLLVFLFVSQELYPQRIPVAQDSVFGLLHLLPSEHLWQMASTYSTFVAVLATIASFIKLKARKQLQALNDLRKQNVDLDAQLQRIKEIYPSTTEIVNTGAHCSTRLILVGTNHLSSHSAAQTDAIVRLLKPCAVVLELDQSRAEKIKDIEQHPYSYQAELPRDICNMTAFKDPITLFARIANRCSSYFFEAGKEFEKAAQAGQHLGSEIVMGDQAIHKTMRSISRNTPIWLKIAINVLLAYCYGWPLLKSLYQLGLEIIVVPNISQLVIRFAVAAALWYMLYVPMFLIIHVLTEQSKLRNGMNRMSWLLKLFGLLMPCLAKVFKQSDMKSKRDHILTRSCLDACEKYANANGENFSSLNNVVVGVVGLAHVDGMVAHAHHVVTDIAARL